MPRFHDSRPAIFISVDIEAAGPSPSVYAMLSIGACVIDELRVDAPDHFYVELQPDRDGVDERAMAVGGFTLEGLRESGTEPTTAMLEFSAWITSVTPDGHRAVMVGFNAPFDWMFVCDYFVRYLGFNPFGHAALDVKAYYMGVTGSTWPDTSMVKVAEHYGVTVDLTHNALDDARDQAALFRAVRAERAAKID